MKHTKQQGTYIKTGTTKMTSPSKELCEICGIKPEIIEDYDSNEYEIYIDFEQPENFKKLFNLNFLHEDEEFGIQEVSIVYYAIYKFLDLYNGNTNSASLLEAIIDALKTGNVESELIKEAIRAEEWKYEW